MGSHNMKIDNDDQRKLFHEIVELVENEHTYRITNKYVIDKIIHKIDLLYTLDQNISSN